MISLINLILFRHLLDLLLKILCFSALVNVHLNLVHIKPFKIFWDMGRYVKTVYAPFNNPVPMINSIRGCYCLGIFGGLLNKLKQDALFSGPFSFLLIVNGKS